MGLIVLDEGKKKIANKIGISDPVTGDDLQIDSEGQAKVKFDPADLRLMISYQAKILEQLEKLNTYMEIITEEEL